MTQAELREAFDAPPFRVLGIEAAEMATNLGGGGRKAWLASIERVAVAGAGVAVTRRAGRRASGDEHEPAERRPFHDQAVGPWGLRERELAAHHGLEHAALQSGVHGGARGLHFVRPRVGQRASRGSRPRRS